MSDNYLTGISNGLIGSYLAYYIPPGATTFTADDYVGALKRDTLRVQTNNPGQPVETDEIPDTPIDYIRSPGIARVAFTLLEVNRPAARRMIHPYSRSALAPNPLSPGIGGEAPLPGSLHSRYEGKLRLVPFVGNMQLNDNDLDPVTAGDSVRHFDLVSMDPESTMEEAFNGGLHELPVLLMVRPCRTEEGRWFHWQYVSSLTSALP